MFITKRHATEMSLLSVMEMGELVEMYTYAVQKFRAARLKNRDGKEIKKYVFFWRLRDDRLDPLSGNIKPDHFHIHLAPDKDHLWDPVIDQDAVGIDLKKLL